MNKPLLTILIPVYNEEKTLKEILKRTTKLPIEKYEVIVVDDASIDKTPQIITDFINNHKAENITLHHIRHPKNRGKGAGIKSALGVARGKYFVVQDANLEYAPEDIPSLVGYAIANGVEAVYGSRFKGTVKDMPLPNYLGNKFYNILLRMMYDTKITDMHTCYKMVRTDLLKELDMQSEGFGYATELVSKLLIRKIPIHEIPISFKGRTKKQGKKINFIDGIDCAKELVNYRINAKKHAPKKK